MGRANGHRRAGIGRGLVLASLVTGCVDSSGREKAFEVQSCMKCHNGSQADDYSGPGIENPHPFPGAENLSCTTCHGGDPRGVGKDESHVPPPPEIGDRAKQATDRHAWFNKLTLAGLDKVASYAANGRTWTALDYLQFVNPGDLRVTTAGRGCGQCHRSHADTVARSPLATETGIFSGAAYAAGLDNAIPAHRGLFEDTAADLAFRAVTDPGFVPDPSRVGVVGSLLEYPVRSVRGRSGPDELFRNPSYAAAALDADVDAQGRAKTGSRLAHLYQEQVAFTCGDCHLGSAGANNRYGDFRSSGCTACHMRYSLDGRSRSRDPNVPKDEPADPDDIDPPERAHVRAHRIASVARTLPGGVAVQGIDDYTCAGCHQGSNRMVMQYWGIRLDQNQDVRRGVQYPANPVSWKSTAKDTRLFDPAVGNRTFNGRNANQYLLFEDYDGDGRDDTPADVHYEAGLGCIDCHGSHDLHGGDVNAAKGGDVVSRMEQAVSIRCESCHGTIDAYAATKQGTTYDGRTAELAVDAKGLVLRHVVKEADGSYWLTSRLTGERHYVPQTRDVTVNTGRKHPVTGRPLYVPKASYAMGRADGDASTGTGPLQTGGALAGFTHTASMSCAACHAAWTNTCVGCHLEGEYDEGNQFSNITGERIVYREKNADFVYQSPVMFQLGIGPDNRIEAASPNTKVFYRYEDRQNVRSRVFAFSDRAGDGANPARPFPALGHNVLMAHSIRGRVTATDEGPRYCVACHLTQNALSKYGSQYDAFRTTLAANDFGKLDFQLLARHVGRNPGNQLDSPIWVHMVAGLGSGLFLFDENGCPVNPLDEDDDRVGCDGVAPADRFDPARVKFDLDRVVEQSGVSRASNNHSMLAPGALPVRRDGATDPRKAGPLGATLVQRLADPVNGIVLNAWIDADGVLRGDASKFVK